MATTNEERLTFTEEIHIPTPWGYLAGMTFILKF